MRNHARFVLLQISLLLCFTARAQQPADHGNLSLNGASLKKPLRSFFNTFIGIGAGRSSAGGDANTLLGANAGFRNASGYGNVFVGAWAGYMNMDGAYNVAIGVRSGEQSEASFNVFTGAESGKFTKGDHNAFLGYRAGYDNTEGAYNTYLGSEAGGIPDIHNATAIGSGAFVAASNAYCAGQWR